MKAFLDDTAQIIGAKFEFGQDIKARSEREAEIARFVLDKAEEVYEEAQKIGGVKFLPTAEAMLMRVVYLKKYSQPEEGKKKAVTGAKETSDKTESKAALGETEIEKIEFNKIGTEKSETKEIEINETEIKEAALEEAELKEIKLREALVKYGNKLVEKDLVQGTWGNLSARIDDEYMLVTPSGIDYDRLTPQDMVKVKINDLSYDSPLKPTSEKSLHAEIYKRRPDIGGIVHTHSTFCSAFAAAEKPLLPEDEKGREYFGNYVDIAKYALPGTGKLAANTADAVADGFGCIMAHHGMVACGQSLKEAYKRAAALEKSAEDYLSRR